MANNKTYDLEDQLARLEDQNKMLQALIRDAANLRADMVDSLTNCGAYLSADGRKTLQELLLKIRNHILQALDQDSQISPPPPEDHDLH